MDKVIEAFNRGYVVSLEGKAYNKNGKEVGFLTKTPDEYESYKICIKINKKPASIAVHRLQAFQKYGYKMFEKGVLVRHFDGDSLNNSWENILIGTDSDNKMDVPE